MGSKPVGVHDAGEETNAGLLYKAIIIAILIIHEN